MKKLNQKYLKTLFNYKDGELYWKISRQSIKINDKAGYINYRYKNIKINGKLYRAHRLIYLYHYGYLPKFLDHIDGDQLNNNIENLRAVTLSQNQWNRKKIKITSSKYKGVTKRSKKWEVCIKINKKSIYLGLFNSEIDAAIAYNEKAIELFGEYAKLNEV